MQHLAISSFKTCRQKKSLRLQSVRQDSGSVAFLAGSSSTNPRLSGNHVCQSTKIRSNMPYNWWEKKGHFGFYMLDDRGSERSMYCPLYDIRNNLRWQFSPPFGRCLCKVEQLMKQVDLAEAGF